MRIAWISQLLPYPPKGGVLQRSYHLIRQAARCGQVHLFALRQAAMHPTLASEAEAIAALQKVCARVEVFPIPSDRNRLSWAGMTAATFFRQAPYDVNWLSSPQLHRRLLEVAKASMFDLVHVDTIGLIPYAAVFREAARVLNHHNVESHMMARRAASERSPWRRLYFGNEARKLRQLERRVCNEVSMNLVVSDLDGVRLREITGTSRTATVDNGVDTEYFTPQRAKPSEELRLIFAGGLNWYPNREAMEYFVRDIWPALKRRFNHVQMSLIGDKPTSELLQAAATDPDFRVLGYVDDVRPYFDDASVYVCPIRDGGGTRLKVLDALAMGIPMVATALAVEGLGMSSGVHYLRAETPDEFVLTIGMLAGDPALRARLAHQGRSFVERRYAWPVIGQKLRAAYDAAISASVDLLAGHVKVI